MHLCFHKIVFERFVMKIEEWSCENAGPLKLKLSFRNNFSLVCFSWHHRIWKPNYSSNYHMGGFHVVDFIITELKDNLICYKLECSLWWNFHLLKKFALQHESCNFNQWEGLNFSRSCDFLSSVIIESTRWRPPLLFLNFPKEGYR